MQMRVRTRIECWGNRVSLWGWREIRGRLCDDWLMNKQVEYLRYARADRVVWFANPLPNPQSEMRRSPMICRAARQRREWSWRVCWRTTGSGVGWDTHAGMVWQRGESRRLQQLTLIIWFRSWMRLLTLIDWTRPHRHSATQPVSI